MPRISNWPAALAKFLREREAVPFKWGENDCCLFAAEWIEVVTGQRPPMADRLRGTYSDLFQAARILEDLGGVERIIADYAASQGWPEVAPAFAQRGDIVVHDGPRGPSLGVCHGRQFAAPFDGGLAHLPMTAARRAWRIC